MLNRLPAQIQHDSDVLTALGSILLTAKEATEAARKFQVALSLRPQYAPYEVNLAKALLDNNQPVEAVRHLEHALELDPLLEKAVSLLAAAYTTQGEAAKASGIVDRYRTAMGITSADSKATKPYFTPVR
jgi:predicted Zn-dependent protease